jgi:hypothetical protein
MGGGGMIDWSNLRETIWDARWDFLDTIARSLWRVSLDNPWMFAVWAILLLALTRRGWSKLLGYVGGTFVRSHSS